ncbi:hypothetical protein Ancab_017737 [Ancistrocladus abbreviatus]
MALEGLIDKRKLDMFNLPYYTPTAEEVRMLIDEEGLFSVNKLETFTVDWDAGCPGGSGMKLDSRAKFVADTMRAMAEPILANEMEATDWREKEVRAARSEVGVLPYVQRTAFCFEQTNGDGPDSHWANKELGLGDKVYNIESPKSSPKGMHTEGPSDLG